MNNNTKLADFLIALGNVLKDDNPVTTEVTEILPIAEPIQETGEIVMQEENVITEAPTQALETPDYSSKIKELQDKLNQLTNPIGGTINAN